MKPMTRMRQRTLVLSLALLTIGCDQVTKHVAGTALKSAARQSYLADTFRLEYAENRGGFLSLGAQLPSHLRVLVFEVGTALTLACAALVILRRRLTVRVAVALTLICAGGLSNLVDRATYGSVVDFLNVGVGSLRSGIFNVADVAILCGSALAIWRRRLKVTSQG